MPRQQQHDDASQEQAQNRSSIGCKCTPVPNWVKWRGGLHFRVQEIRHLLSLFSSAAPQLEWRSLERRNVSLSVLCSVRKARTVCETDQSISRYLLNEWLRSAPDLAQSELCLHRLYSADNPKSKFCFLLCKSYLHNNLAHRYFINRVSVTCKTCQRKNFNLHIKFELFFKGFIWTSNPISN